MSCLCALAVTLLATAAPRSIEWAREEAGILANQTQLTFPAQFVKAGESYFSPDGRRVVFQAIENPADGSEPEEFYAMFVADLVRGEGEGAPKWRLENIRRVSPQGSANTCGWFHPLEPDRLLYASTIGPPTASSPPGYQRGTSRYRWSFPPEMRIVEVDLREIPSIPLGSRADIPRDMIRHIEGDGRAYVAECSLDPTGRHLLYCSLAAHDGDILVKDLRDGSITTLVTAPGYDGGPFFSPNADRICYRSDRSGNNLLQLYVADLVRDESGRITGVSREYAVTANTDVNWCPYWHPAGRHLVYATSAMGHRNYEVFIVDAASFAGAIPPQSRYGTNPRRVTHAEGADVLPAFDSTGSIMMWTSQRAPDRSSQLWIADFVMPLEPLRGDFQPQHEGSGTGAGRRLGGEDGGEEGTMPDRGGASSGGGR